MSRKLFNDNEINSVILRLKLHYGINNDKDLANIIGMAGTNFSMKKKAGTLINDLFFHCKKENLDLNYIFKGKN